jgi:hypothetical protein
VSESKRPSWRELYRAALVEIDPVKLAALIEQARQAVHERRRELLLAADREEQQALDDALHSLQWLQRETR